MIQSTKTTSKGKDLFNDADNIFEQKFDYNQSELKK